jgi:amino acid transporter
MLWRKNNAVVEEASVKRAPSDLESQEKDGSTEAFDPDTGVKRALKDRHISLIALAGIIGPGILVGAGITLRTGGPLALLIGVVLIGFVAFSIMISLGEMISIYPSGNGFTTLARRFHSNALGAVSGYNYVIVWFCVLSNEYNTLSSIMTFWDKEQKVPLYGYILLFWVFFQAFQMLGVEAFGEAEYWLALVKIFGLIAYYIFSIVYISGGIKGTPAFGFHYWNDPGALTHGFRGIASVFTYVSTFYSGVEGISTTVSEAKNPRHAIPKAIRQTVFRIIFIYVFIAIFYGATVPSNDPALLSSERALKSPIAIAIVNAGWAGGNDLVNAFILVTCLSAVNSSIYIGSRTLTNLASEGLAPKIIAWKNRRGVPVVAITVMNLLGLISIMNVSTGASNAFGYIVNISGVAVFIVWGIISYTHIRVRKAWEVQGFDLDQLPYRTRFFPWVAWFGLIANVFLALVQGWTTLSPFVAGDFVDSYILLPFAFVIYGIAAFFKGFTVVDLSELDLDEGRREDIDLSEDLGGVPWFKKLWNSL